MGKLVVIAFGGNALLKSGQIGTNEEQSANARIASENLLNLIKQGYDVVVTHGNGPQVGNIILANSAGHKEHGIADMPLDVAVAYSQGFIAYLIENQLHNVLNENKIDKNIISIVTQVEVDKNDSAFKNLTKPVGPYYTKEEAEKIMQETGAVFKEDARGRGWRKVVASPYPLSVQNANIVESLVRSGNIVIAVGGGGIPVCRDENNNIHGVEAVIDKDLASSLLARTINADEFYILTDVPKVCINFNTPEEQTIDKMTVAEAKKHFEDGQFAPGSMGPKVRAAIEYVEATGKEAIITSIDTLGKENSGTKIVL